MELGEDQVLSSVHGIPKGSKTRLGVPRSHPTWSYWDVQESKITELWKNERSLISKRRASQDLEQDKKQIKCQRHSQVH